MKVNFIPYRKVKQKDLVEFELSNWLEVETNTISPVISQGYDDFFKKEKFDRNSFRQQIFALLIEDLSLISSLTLICRFDRDSIDYFGCLYLQKPQILLVKFKNSPNFDAWIDALVGQMSRNKGITMRLGQNQFSVSILISRFFPTNIPQFIRENAPKHYSLRKQQAIKKKFLNSFQVLDSMQQEIDLEQTKLLWQEFLALTPSSERQVNPGCDRSLLESFKQKIGYELPAELAILYELNNGGVKIFFNFDFMPLKQVIKTWRDWQTIFKDWTLEELRGNNYPDSDRTLGMYTNPYWIAFIDTIGGNYIAIDLMPGKAGKIGQIIMFGADTDCVTCLAENLNHFLTLCIALKKYPRRKNFLKIIFNS